MKKTVIYGEIQIIYEGTPEEISALEYLETLKLEEEEEQKNYRFNAQENIKVLKGLEKELRDAVLEKHGYK